MADIKDRNLRKRLQKFCRISTLKSSNVPIGSADLWSCPNAGSSSAPLPGSTAAAAWPRIGSASTERPWRSCASPQSASCSENYVIRPEVSGRTLRDRPAPAVTEITYLLREPRLALLHPISRRDLLWESAMSPFKGT